MNHHKKDKLKKACLFFSLGYFIDIKVWSHSNTAGWTAVKMLQTPKVGVRGTLRLSGNSASAL